MSSNSEYERAMAYALRLLAICMRTEQEISQRLQKKGFGADSTIKVILRLRELNYLDDSSYVESYIRSRIKPTGRQRLKYELVRKGISPDLADEGLKSTYSEEEELKAAQRMAEKILRLQQRTNTNSEKVNISDETYRRNLQKIGAKLMARGFAYPIVLGVMQKMNLYCSKEE